MKMTRVIGSVFMLLAFFFFLQPSYAGVVCAKSAAAKSAKSLTAVQQLAAMNKVQSRAGLKTVIVQAGKVVWIKGTFTATNEDNEKRTLEGKSDINEHDTLETGPNSQAQVVMLDNTLMTFQENTKFYIDQYKFDPKADAKKGSVGKSVMSLIEGGFRTITGVIAKANSADYRVNTPVATIGVRGTDYAVFTRDCQVYVNFYKGQPFITTELGTLNLNDKVRYVTVSGPGEGAVKLQNQPDVFRIKLQIEPVTFGSQVSGLMGKGGSITIGKPGVNIPAGFGGGKATSSFCIK